MTLTYAGWLHCVIIGVGYLNEASAFAPWLLGQRHTTFFAITYAVVEVFATRLFRQHTILPWMLLVGVAQPHLVACLLGVMITTGYLSALLHPNGTPPAHAMTRWSNDGIAWSLTIPIISAAALSSAYNLFVQSLAAPFSSFDDLLGAISLHVGLIFFLACRCADLGLAHFTSGNPWVASKRWGALKMSFELLSTKMVARVVMGQDAMPLWNLPDEAAAAAMFPLDQTDGTGYRASLKKSPWVNGLFTVAMLGGMWLDRRAARLQ